MGKVKEYAKILDDDKRIKKFNELDICRLNFPFFVLNKKKRGKKDE